jgi:hypothetical protein
LHGGTLAAGHVAGQWILWLSGPYLL